MSFNIIYLLLIRTVQKIIDQHINLTFNGRHGGDISEGTATSGY